MSIATQDRFRGCLLGATIGSALGYPLRRMTANKIETEIGLDRACILPVDPTSKVAPVSAGVQQMLFTAEGLLRAEARGRTKGICHPPGVVHHAYLRWQLTQELEHAARFLKNSEGAPDGWLCKVQRLYATRTNGKTAHAKLFEEGSHSFGFKAKNSSKGSLAALRSAPIGLFAINPDDCWETAVECAAITHGHTEAQQAAAAFALLIHFLRDGGSLQRSSSSLQRYLAEVRVESEVGRAVDNAIDAAGSGATVKIACGGPGNGLTAASALGQGLFFALRNEESFARSMAESVSIDGDSSAVAMITGSILGTCIGASRLPDEMVFNVELSDVVTQIADDLDQRYVADPEDNYGGSAQSWWDKYPGW